jgi:hypothetical protein
MNPLYSVSSPIDGAPAPESLMEPDLLIRFSSGLPPWFPLACGAVLLLVVLVRVLYRRRSRIAPPDLPDQEPTAPHVAAFEALDALGRSLPGQVGEEDAFYVDLSGIVRRYLHDRFGMSALEMASHEILVFLAGKDRPAHGSEPLRALLERCDRVKFGKRSAGRAAARDAVALAREFVGAVPLPDRQGTQRGAL